MKKLVILVSLLFILTGCTANYSVNIKSDGKVEEKLIINFNSGDIDTTNVGALIDETIKTYRDNNMYIDYKIKKNITKDKSSVIVTRKYPSLNSYISSSEILPILFEKTAYIEEYNIKGLQTMGEYYHDSVFEASAAEEPPFSQIDVEVHSQLEIIENNATKYDKDSNTATWNITGENKTFSMNFKYNNSKRYDIIIKDYLKENWSSILIVVVILVSVVIVINYIRKQDKLNNKI